MGRVMNDVPRQKLSEILSRYGQSVCDDPKRCESLLLDLCGEHRREIFVLVSTTTTDAEVESSCGRGGAAAGGNRDECGRV